MAHMRQKPTQTRNYRGYALVYDEGACDVWSGPDWLHCVYSPNPLADAMAVVDDWMTAP